MISANQLPVLLFKLAPFDAGLGVVLMLLAMFWLRQLLERLQSNHRQVWQKLGQPKLGNMAPGVSQAIYHFLQDKHWRDLDDPIVSRLAPMILMCGWLALSFLMLGALCVAGAFFLIQLQA